MEQSVLKLKHIGSEGSFVFFHLDFAFSFEAPTVDLCLRPELLKKNGHTSLTVKTNDGFL